MTESKVDESEAPKTKIIKKIVDVDQKEKALALHTRDVENFPETNFFFINEYAAKAHREEFLDYINRSFPEFFEENDEQEILLKSSNERAGEDMAKYVKSNCGEYDHPCLVFERNAGELE